MIKCLRVECQRSRAEVTPTTAWRRHRKSNKIEAEGEKIGRGKSTVVYLWLKSLTQLELD